MNSNDAKLEALRDVVPGVSRETFERLVQYESLLRQWTRRINLVSQSTVDDAWNRHFLDSAQIARHLSPTGGHLIDLGSGGGFPGAVLAILRPDIHVTCVESDQRKATFLRTVARETGTSMTVLAQRIEDVSRTPFNHATSRALAPLPHLIEMAAPFLEPRGSAIFLKGESHKAEVQEALETWSFDCETHPSRTNPGGALLVLKEIRRA